MLEKGYKRLESKLPGNKGIDGVWAKYDADGNIIELVVTESKYRTNAKNFTDGLLEETKDGRQMSKQWLRKKIEEMKKSGDPELQKTGRELEANFTTIDRKGSLVNPGAPAKLSNLNHLE